MSFREPGFDCAVDAAMSVIGGRWKAAILCKLYMKGPIRFNKLVSELGTISPKVLTKQLRGMESDGLISRVTFPEIPPHVEYSLSSRGASLLPILSQLSEWGRNNMYCNMVKIEPNVMESPILSGEY